MRVSQKQALKRRFDYKGFIWKVTVGRTCMGVEPERERKLLLTRKPWAMGAHFLWEHLGDCRTTAELFTGRVRRSTYLCLTFHLALVEDCSQEYRLASLQICAVHWLSSPVGPEAALRQRGSQMLRSWWLIQEAGLWRRCRHRHGWDLLELGRHVPS